MLNNILEFLDDHGLHLSIGYIFLLILVIIAIRLLESKSYMEDDQGNIICNNCNYTLDRDTKRMLIKYSGYPLKCPCCGKVLMDIDKK